MEIGNLITQEVADEGKWFGVILYGKKQPFAIKIYGSDSDRLQKFQREQFKKLQENRKDLDEMSDEVIEQVLESNIDSVIVRIGGLKSIKWNKFGEGFEFIDEPVTMNGKTLKDDEASFRELIDKIPAVKDFVNKKSNERTNFLADGKKN